MTHKITQIIQLTGFPLYITSSPLQSQSGLYRQLSEYLPHPPVFLPRCGWLLYVVLL
jgi:hypothetical protein